jgi:replicative DNA helicase
VDEIMAFPLPSGTDGGSLPRSDEAERAVLAAVLLDPYTLPSVTARLVPEDFFSEKHRVIYQAMLDLQEESTSIDLRTLQGRLEQRKQFDAVGGVISICRTCRGWTPTSTSSRSGRSGGGSSRPRSR